MSPDAEPLPVRRAVISGRVQGVGFRWAAKKEAQRLGLVGEVKNLTDGTVLACFWGKPYKMNDFEDFLRHGPVLARVSHLEVQDFNDAPDYHAFEITR